ncbi:MAG TPA: nuclear transport factor 2 family protein [Bauldia sp.]|nr:nuclear transport factor 2 family protein [Bauldia sp.]
MSLEQDILALEKKFWQSMIDRDAAAGAAMIAEESLVTGAQGVGKIDRATFAKMMEGGQWTLHDFAFSDVKFVEVTRDVAVIAYKVREDLTVDGRRFTMEAADASTWVRDNGTWVCALHTESVLGDPYGRDRKG